MMFNVSTMENNWILNQIFFVGVRILISNDEFDIQSHLLYSVSFVDKILLFEFVLRHEI